MKNRACSAFNKNRYHLFYIILLLSLHAGSAYAAEVKEDLIFGNPGDKNNNQAIKLTQEGQFKDHNNFTWNCSSDAKITNGGGELSSCYSYAGDKNTNSSYIEISWIADKDYLVTQFELNAYANGENPQIILTIGSNKSTHTAPIKKGATYYAYSTNSYSISLAKGEKITARIQKDQSKAVTGIVGLKYTFVESTTKTTVTLNPNAGSGEKQTITTEETTYTVPSCDFNRTGYTFAKWNTQADGTGKDYTPKDEITLDGTAVNLYAIWTPVTYTITYELNGGTNHASNPAYYTIETETITLQNPNKANHNFVGWYKESTFATQVMQIANGSTDNITLYAKWQEVVVSNNCRWIETDITEIESTDEVVVTMTWGDQIWALPNDGGTSTPIAVIVDNVEGEEMISVSDNMIWTIDESEGSYILYPKGSNSTWLYCTNNNDGVRVGTGENKYFTIVNGLASDSENYFLYNNATLRYVGVYHPNEGIPDWRCYKLTDKGAFPTNIKNQSLKFYKKTCLMSNEFWIDYELANVTCTNTPPHSQIAKDSETLLLEFTANDGYLLPEDIDVQMENGTLSFDWEKQSGQLTINKPDGGYTGNITITISGCKALATPTNLSAVVTSTSVTLSWKEVPDAQSYEVHIMDEDNSDIIQNTTTCEVTISGLTKDTYYVWGVTPIKEGFCGIQEISNFTTLDVFTVTFNNQGKAENFTQQVDAGSKATVPTVPTTTGYTFAGWYTEADTEFNFNTPIESATTLYAKWDIVTYNITYVGLEGVTNHIDNPATYTIETPSITFNAPSAREGYIFDGWNPTTLERGTYGDQIITATWEKGKIVTWKVDGEEITKQTYRSGDPLVLPSQEVEACQGSEFVGWTDDEDYFNATTAPTYVTAGSAVKDDATYYAVYAEVTLGEPIKEEITNTYTFSNYTAGTQYATNEEHILDEDVTIYTTQCHFTTELRIYASNTHNGYVESNKLPGNIISIGFNAGDNSDNLLVYGSENGSDWNQIGKVAVNSSYKDYTLDFGETDYTYFKLDVEGSSQIRIKSMFITYMRVSEEVSTDYINYSTSCIPTYHVNYELAGGENGCVDKGVKVGNDYTICGEEPTRTGYTFQYWTDGTNTYEAGATIYDVQADITLTATWKEREKYTLTFNDQGESKEFQYTESLPVEMQEPWAEICSGPIQYVFDGWATASVNNGTAEYEKVDFSTFIMPAANTTLYAVYRYAEDGKEPVNGFVKVTEALTDWSGDYVIVNEDVKKAIRNAYKDSDKNTLEALDVAIENNEIVLPSEDIIWQIRKDGENYTMYNADAGTYAYITAGDSKNAGLSDSKENITISWGSDATTIRVCGSGGYTARCFSYYKDKQEWRTYSTTGNSTGALYRLSEKTILYTSSLICGSITAEDALVTSTKDQKVKVKVPITLESSTGATTVTATSDNAAFAVTGLTDVEAGDYTIEVEYTPAEYKTTETANITLSATNGATTTFTVTGRSLPENFVIATKVGATWYALPANMSGATNPEGVLIDVDETTMTATAPNTTVYTLFPVATVDGNSDRYNEYGERLRFAAVNNGNRGLWANDAKSGTTINNDAAITAANSTAGAAYEWKITTTIVDGNWQYTLQTDQPNNQKYLRYWTAASGGAKWGTYASGNDKLYFLPVTTYTDLDLEVMEWGTNSMVIRAGEDLPQNVNITINGTTTSKTLQNINGSDLYKIDDVTLTSDDCGTIIIDNGSNARKIIRKPLLVSGNKSGSEYTTSPGRDICAECDIVILNGGKLIADEAKSTGSHVDFANIYVYPGGKLVLDGKSLGVKRQVYLRGGYSWINQTTYALPEVYVNGDINFNGSGNIIYDYYIQNYKYYQFSLPYQVPLAKVTDEAGVDNFPVWVKHYNGALRAANANATSWEWYYGDNFEAGIGYIIAAQPRQEGKVANRPLSIIRFPLGNGIISSAEADKSIATTAHGIDAYNAGTITANNVGWNFIGNPFMATWKGDIGHQQLMKSPDAEHWNGSYHWENNDVKYITVMSPEDGTDYAQYIAANTELKPFFPFYLQETAEGGAGTINFATANRIQKAPAELYADEPREALVQVEILTDRVEDQTGVFISDTYSDDIDFDDYEKIFGSSADKSKLWFIHEDKRMAFEAMTEASAAANIALGYRAPRLGKYTFAINEDVSALNEVVGVYLTDHELGLTDYNLLNNTYEFETKATNYNDQRFTIRIVLRDDSDGVVTGVDNIETMNDGIYKFIYQDKMYIYNDGIIYDATGKQVTNINK